MLGTLRFMAMLTLRVRVMRGAGPAPPKGLAPVYPILRWLSCSVFRV